MSIPLRVSRRVRDKLIKKHNVDIGSVWECFQNRTKGLLEDTRLDNKTDPPTYWFISKTEQGRVLKIVFIEEPKGIYQIKTAYEPNDNEVKIYERYA